VFTRSISGLEFMLHAAERRAVTVAAEDGPEALIDLIREIRDTSERERATDDAEAVTDAASFRSANHYLQAHEHTGDAMLENWLPSYLRAIGRTAAAKQVTDTKDVNLRIWRLKPDDVVDYKLVGLERQGDNPLADMYGTFSRTVARERPDLDFFAVGHPLVDALAVAVREHIQGRSVLAVLHTDLMAPGLVLLAAWRVRGLEDSDAVPGRALRLLEDRIVWTGVDIETGEVVDAALARRLADQLHADDSSVHDMSLEKAIETFRPEPGQWSATLDALLAHAAGQARGTYAARYGEVDAAFCEQLRADANALAQARVEESAAYGEEVEAIAQAIRSAQLELDVLGMAKLVAPVAP
jgi:ATP-dependent helicase HepA